MRDATDLILEFNRDFHRPSLALKLERMSCSVFSFYRGTFHLFAFDLCEGPFRKWPSTEAAGRIIGDLHTENFGCYRAITNEIVYDINDFDETTTAPYEYDLRRMTTALLVASLDNGQPLSVGVAAAEAYVREYLLSCARYARAASPAALRRSSEHRQIRSLLMSAAERSRAEMMKELTVEDAGGRFVFQACEHYQPVTAGQKKAIARALPDFLETCIAPAGARTSRYTLQDVAFRYAGTGSLGRRRFGLLLGKGRPPQETLHTLRLVEWKDSLDSALDRPLRPHQSRRRARNVIESTIAFQLFPKRYLGYAMLSGEPVQAREIGANDARFQHNVYRAPERFEQAAKVFGQITARAHTLAATRGHGPERLVRELQKREDRFVQRMLTFAVDYTARAHDDFDEFRARHDEVAAAWAVPK